jgi:hypothetical protein
MYRLGDHIRTVGNEDGGALLDIESGKILRLSPTAALIVEQLQRGLTVKQIADGLSQRFGIPQTAACCDVTEFLSTLEKQHLISAMTEERRP